MPSGVLPTPGGVKFTARPKRHHSRSRPLPSTKRPSGVRGRLQSAGSTLLLVGRNGPKLTTSDDYFSKDLSDRGHEASRGGSGQRAGIQK